jgi:hypothetical protein
MTITEKADRLLLSGHVTIDTQRAHVKGDHGVYVLTQLQNRWWCSCPARKKCSHIEAVERVT